MVRIMPSRQVGIVIFLSFLLVLWGKSSFSKTYDGVLAEPVALGAWIYQGKCLGCHGSYDSAHLAEEYDDDEELSEAIGSSGCRISWARKNGGVLGHSEIHGLVSFMFAWEEEGTAPNLPELPAQPVEPVKPKTQGKGTQKSLKTGSLKEPSLSQELQHLIKHSPLAKGGWLYIQNCYRCHLTYTQARMGKGLERETIGRFISEGKTSTQMTPFSRLLGGSLKNSEIGAIVQYILAWEKAGEPLAIASELMTPPALDPVEFVPIRLSRFPLVTGDGKMGEELYRINCVSCHGARGAGGLAPSLRHQWGLRPDLYIKSTIKKGVSQSLMVAWERGESRLSAKNIGDLVTYILEFGTTPIDSADLKLRIDSSPK